jgi:hypothetical protein
MSEKWSETRTEQAGDDPNGTGPDEAVGIGDAPTEDANGSASEPADESTTSSELDTDVSGSAEEEAVTSLDTAEADDGAGAAVDDVAAASVELGPPDDGSAFLSELARAMQTTAGIERARIADDTDRRRQAQIDQVRARQKSEADRMRELADEDLKAIDAWADGERKRIADEQDRRATAVRDDLEASLSEHRSKIDREIEGVETAIAAYRSEVAAYFAALDHETDPVLIAQQAARRPVFPTLEVSVETAAAASEAAGVESIPAYAASEPAAVGVMDPDAATEPLESWAASPAVTDASADTADVADQGSEVQEPGEPVPAASGSTHETSGSLFHSVPALRPGGWLRRDTNSGDSPNRES